MEARCTLVIAWGNLPVSPVLLTGLVTIAHPSSCGNLQGGVGGNESGEAVQSAKGTHAALQTRNFLFFWQGFVDLRLLTFTLCHLPFGFLLRFGRAALPALRYALTLPWLEVRRDQAFKLRRRHGFFEIIRSAKLHGLEIAFHLQATRQHHHRCVPVACQVSSTRGARFKGRASLAHDDEVEVLVFQAPLRLSEIRESSDRVTHSPQQRGEILQILFILINQQDPSTGKAKLG